AASAWQHVLDHHDRAALADLTGALAAASEVEAALARVLACSPFVAGLVRRQPRLLAGLLQDGLLQRSLHPGEVHRELQQRLAEPGAELQRVLRRFRARHMLRIVWRDFCRSADTLETVQDTSALAEACITQAQSYLQHQLEARFGVPRGRRSGEAQQ